MIHGLIVLTQGFVSFAVYFSGTPAQVSLLFEGAQAWIDQGGEMEFDWERMW